MVMWDGMQPLSIDEARFLKKTTRGPGDKAFVAIPAPTLISQNRNLGLHPAAAKNLQTDLATDHDSSNFLELSHR